MVAAVVTAAIYARQLGVEQFGALAFAQSFAVMFLFLVVLGGDGVLLRELHASGRRREFVIANMVALRAVLSALAIIVCVLCSSVFLSRDILLAIAALILLGPVIDVGAVCLKDSSDGIVLFKSGVLTTSVFLMLKIGAAYLAFGAPVLLGLIVVETITSGLVNWLVARARLDFAMRIEDLAPKYIMSLLIKNWPLAVSMGIMGALTKIDQLFVRNILPADALGQYMAAVRIYDVFALFLATTVGALSPILYRSVQQGGEALSRSVLLLFNVVGLLSLSFVIISFCFGHFAVRLLFGDAFAGDANVLILLACGGVFAASAVASTEWLIAEELAHFRLVRAGVGIAVAVVAGLILVPRYHAVGAAGAFALTQAVSGVLVYAIFNRTRALFSLQLRGLLFIDVLIWLRSGASRFVCSRWVLPSKHG